MRARDKILSCVTLIPRGTIRPSWKTHWSPRVRTASLSVMLLVEQPVIVRTKSPTVSSKAPSGYTKTNVAKKPRPSPLCLLDTRWRPMATLSMCKSKSNASSRAFVSSTIWLPRKPRTIRLSTSISPQTLADLRIRTLSDNLTRKRLSSNKHFTIKSFSASSRTTPTHICNSKRDRLRSSLWIHVASQDRSNSSLPSKRAACYSKTI